MCLCHEQSVRLLIPKRGWIRSRNLIITRGLGPLIFLTPPYPDGVGACFQMAACSSAGLISGREYLRTQASLWSIDGPGVAKAPHKQAFREQRVADIVLPQDRRVGIYRDLKNECQGLAPYFCSKSYCGAPCGTCKRKDSPWILFLVQYIVCPIRRQLRAMARPSISHTSWVMPNCWLAIEADSRATALCPRESAWKSLTSSFTCRKPFQQPTCKSTTRLYRFASSSLELCNTWTWKQCRQQCPTARSCFSHGLHRRVRLPYHCTAHR